MLRRLIKRVLFGKRKYYKRYYVTHKHHNNDINVLHHIIDSMLDKLKLQRIGPGTLIGDKKDAKKYYDKAFGRK